MELDGIGHAHGGLGRTDLLGAAVQLVGAGCQEDGAVDAAALDAEAGVGSVGNAAAGAHSGGLHLDNVTDLCTEAGVWVCGVNTTHALENVRVCDVDERETNGGIWVALEEGSDLSVDDRSSLRNVKVECARGERGECQRPIAVPWPKTAPTAAQTAAVCPGARVAARTWRQREHFGLLHHYSVVVRGICLPSLPRLCRTRGANLERILHEKDIEYVIVPQFCLPIRLQLRRCNCAVSFHEGGVHAYPCRQELSP
mmetsp:Transcript_13300/g.53001  ORF Transcript_13300/g.53001 Transcript_13300/m.53001 type:complete len:255 (-) Transcript_13300:202-966(-)